MSEQGKFKGLDLNEDLFVGGYPNYSMLAKTAGLKTGFVGEKTVILCEFFLESVSCSIIIICILTLSFGLSSRLYQAADYPR